MHATLLLLGAALAAALSWQAFRTQQLEAAARAVELERAEIAAERILRAAQGSRAVWELLPAAQRFALRGAEIVADDAVGWLHEVPARDDADPVVLDRLDRAARAEFGAGDAAAAAREYDELLAGPLIANWRLAVLAAAAWQARRAGAAERLAGLQHELDAGIAALDPSDLARAAIATAVAAALRLPRAGAAPAWAERLAPFLPGAALAGLPLPDPLARAQREVEARRALLAAAAAEWRAVTAPGREGLRAAAGGRVLWWLPRDGGGTDAALVPLPAWLDAVRAAGRAGQLPEWPWLVEPAVSANAAAACAGVPWLQGLRPAADSPLASRPWVLPAVTLLLLAAFALALAAQFRAARREAAAVAAHAEFLTTVTHELKTPLASIRLLGEMLLEGRAAGREADYYRMLAGEAARLSMLIENVLDLGRVERGERAYDLRPCDVGEVVRETVELLAPVARRDRAEIVVQVPDGEPVRARLDRGAFVQALVAVLDNARKYGAGPIDVAVRADGPGQVCVAVRDRGPGVPVAERERIFERFVRGSAHRHGATPGVGIGLYLARAIARRLGGELACGAPLDSGPGARFTFTFPAEGSA